MKYAAGKPIIQKPTPTEKRTSRHPNVSMDRTRTGTINPPTPVQAIRIAGFDRGDVDDERIEDVVRVEVYAYMTT